MILSERFTNAGGHFNSEVYRVFMVMDSLGIEFNQDDEEFIKLIRSVAVELEKVDRLDIGMRALENINKNNEPK